MHVKLNLNIGIKLHRTTMSRPESRSDLIGGSESSSGCETQDWDSLPDFFFKTELVPVGMAHNLLQNQNIIYFYRVPFTYTKLNFYIYKSERGTNM